MGSLLVCFGHFPFPVCKFCPAPNSKLRFASVSHVFGEVGHTHGPVDQRLSIAVTAFSNEDTIQSPEEALALLKFRILIPHHRGKRTNMSLVVLSSLQAATKNLLRIS